MLDRLPDELIWMVAGQLRQLVDLKKLCETSKRFHQVLLPLLYEKVTLLIDVDCRRGAPYLRTNIPVDHLKYTRHILILKAKSDEPPALALRCPHKTMTEWWYYCRYEPRLASPPISYYFDDDPDPPSPTTMHEDPPNPPEPYSFLPMVESLVELLSHLQRNTLRSFGWALNGCVPTEIFGPESEFANHQRCIENLSLAIDPYCKHNSHKQFRIDLSRQKTIKSLDWTATIKHDDFDVLRKSIRDNGRTITSLKLDFVDWEMVDYMWAELVSRDPRSFRGPPEDILARSILGIKHGEDVELLPSLADLSLSSACFESPREIVRALHMNGLRSLKLWKCSFCLEMLNALAESGGMPHLKSLELTLSEDFCATLELDIAPVSQFLSSLRGLTDLFLALETPFYWDSIISALLHHASTLRRLVVHSRVFHDDFDERVDWSAFDSNNAKILFRHIALDCMAASASSFTKTWAWSTLSLLNPKCRLIHIRYDGKFLETSASAWPSHFPRPEDDTASDDSSSASSIENDERMIEAMRKEVVDFAQRVFRTDSRGLPSIQVVAFGDFSHDGRHGSHNLLLCRDENEASQKNSGVRTLIDVRRTKRLPGWMAPGVRKLMDTDRALWELVNDNMDMLSACPCQPAHDWIGVEDLKNLE